MSATKNDVNQLLNQARVLLVGSSDAELKAALFNVLNDFFNDSNSWIENIPVNIIANTTSYDIVPSAGKIVRLAGVVDALGIPAPAIMPDFGTLVFANAYSQAAVFRAYVCLTVELPNNKDGIPEMPDFALSVYGTTILSGLLGDMMIQPNKSYTSAKSGAYHQRKFRIGTNSARVATLRRMTIGTQAWRFPQTFAVSGQRGGVSVGNDQRFT